MRALSLLALLACQPPAAETISLNPGATYDRTLIQGHPHRFRFDLSANHFLHLSVEQRGVDVVVGLLDPSGRVLYEIDSPSGDRSPETVLAVAPVSGEYTLKVAPLEEEAEGDYILVVHALRPATPEDRRRAATAATLARAERQWQDGDYEKAAASFREALPELERRGQAREAAQARWRLGTALQWTGALRESAVLLERSAAGFRGERDGLHEARVLIDLGTARRLLGEPGRALEAFQRALGLYRRAGRRAGEATALHSLGYVLESTGDLQGALSRYEEALALRRQLGAKSAEAASLQSLGSLYVLIGHDEEGLDLLRKAQELRAGEKDERARVSILAALGWAEYLSGDPEKALVRYEEAIALAQRTGDRLMETGVRDRHGTILKALGRTAEAGATYTRSLEISRATGSPRSEGNNLANLGWLHLETGDLARARQELRRAVDLLAASGDPNGEAFARLGLSRAERKLGAWEPARQQIEAALRIVEDLRTGLRGPASRSQFLATRYDAWEELVALRMETGQPGPALEAAEQARARNLLDLLNESPSPSEDLRRNRELQAEIETLDERRRAIAARDPRDPRLPGLAAALRERSLELDRFSPSPGGGRVGDGRGGQGVRIPPEAAPPSRQTLTARQIQSLADRDTLLVVYLLAEPESFAWTVDRDRIVSHVLPGREKIETLARRVAAALPKSHERVAQSAAERAVRDLAEAILAPLGERLAGRPRLAILPDGALHLVAFGALPSPPLPGDGSADGRGGRGVRVPLLLDHEIVLLPSATALLRQRQRLAGRAPVPGELAILADPIFSPDDPRLHPGRDAETAAERGAPALGFGPLARLPYTTDEAQAIARLVPEPERLVALGAAASRDLATSGALSRYRILHFAAHGLLHPVLPERSGLVLSQFDENGRPRDGFLSAPDVAALDLPADLVVLSACRTGLGRQIRGEGLVGLTQAFFRAGARGVIVSSWDVRDRATATLMTRFYENHLTRRLPPAAALREAQLALRRDPETAAPSYWAGFALHGDWR